jgi:hypothetical protein
VSRRDCKRVGGLQQEDPTVEGHEPTVVVPFPVGVDQVKETLVAMSGDSSTRTHRELEDAEGTDGGGGTLRS